MQESVAATVATRVPRKPGLHALLRISSGADALAGLSCALWTHEGGRLYSIEDLEWGEVPRVKAEPFFFF